MAFDLLPLTFLNELVVPSIALGRFKLDTEFNYTQAGIEKNV